MLYYFYDHMSASEENLQIYHLQPNRSHRYLRILEGDLSMTPRNSSETNIIKFKELQDILKEFDFSDEQIATVNKILAAILVMGEVTFRGEPNDNAEIDEYEEQAQKVAQLLDVDAQKFSWSLLNYCFVNKGVAVRKQHTCDEARSARDVLANNLYSRFVDYIIACINHKLSYGRAIL